MSPETRLPKRFVVDSMLGKVAKWLRVLGFDTLYTRLHHLDQIAQYRREGYLLITRNRRWCQQSQVLCLESNDPMEQLAEVIERVPVAVEETRWLHRCVACNEQLQPIARTQVFGQVPDYTYETQSTFFRCPNCERIYWPGSHPSRMSERLRRVLGWSVQGLNANKGG